MAIKVLVCGSRDCDDKELITKVLDKCHHNNGIYRIIHGAAPGADTLAGEWAVENDIALDTYPANWDKYGKRAGFVRNKEMAEIGKPDLVIAFSGGHDTDLMCQIARGFSIPILKITETVQTFTAKDGTIYWEVQDSTGFTMSGGAYATHVLAFEEGQRVAAAMEKARKER